MRKRQDSDPVALAALVEEGHATTPGALVDLLTERGDAVVVDTLGRLAAPAPVAERLRAEQEERERVAQEEARLAEERRLAALREQVELEEQEQLRWAREQAIRERMARLERKTGTSVMALEQAVRRSGGQQDPPIDPVATLR